MMPEADAAEGKPVLAATEKLLYRREEAAAALALSVSTVDVMIARGMLRAVRKGRRVLIARAELERVAKANLPAIWPKKRNQKTTRGERKVPGARTHGEVGPV